MTDAAAVFDDLSAEGEELDGLVAGLSDAEWATATPSPGWTIAHQIAHLAWTDDRAILAVADPDGFTAELVEFVAKAATIVDEAAADGAAVRPPELLERWRLSRAKVHEVLLGLPAGQRIPWYGPPMSAPSMATARLMETWAHGLDVADALGVRREPTVRLRHVARLAVRTRDFAYAVRGEQPPREEFRVELTGPDGETWAYGPEDAAQGVTGPGLDLCLLAAQRRHRDDLALVAEGADADHWLDIAQMFAGPPGDGREPEVAG